MSPNDPTSANVPETPPTNVSPPVFHNPLVEGYTPPASQPVGEPLVQPQPEPVLPSEPVVPAPPPAPDLAPAPSVMDLQDEDYPHPPPIQPAPVRLAPVPRGNDVHAQGLADSAQTQPFSTVPAAHVAEAAALPLVSTPKKSSRKPLTIVISAIALLVLGVGGWYAGTKLASSKKPVSQSTPTPKNTPKRDTDRKNLAVGYARVETPCYTVQLPEQNEVQVNKDCRLAVAYGETKASTVVVSPYKDFDLVGSSDQTDDKGQVKQFDSSKILEGLIASTTAGRTVAERQDIKVGNIDTVKVTSTSSSNGEVVAYAFIVLPESDQSFEEKKFIAFIVTGAYNDEASRAAFDNLLSNWQWL